MKVLWASYHCLLDRSSGAAMTAREQLLALQRRGHRCRVLGATTFDHPRGMSAIAPHWAGLKQHEGKIAQITDGKMPFEMLVTAETSRARVTAAEEFVWHRRYVETLDTHRPDIVYFYGAYPADLLIADEARRRGIAVAYQLVSGNYRGSRWCRDVDVAITDSMATATLYEKRLGLQPAAVGTFIDPSGVVAQAQTRERVLFVNPAFEKGGAVAARLAILLEKRRPDIVFEVVESRGGWEEALSHAFAVHDEPSRPLANVEVVPGQPDMRVSYRRARVLLAPSLWWESGARVAVEAMMNGIPAIVSAHGGMPELVGDGGCVVQLPEEVLQPPYRLLPSDEALEPIVRQIEGLYDDSGAYEALSEKARAIARDRHAIDNNAARLEAVFEQAIVARNARGSA